MSATSSPPGAAASKAGVTLLLTSAATFMAFLDTTVVNIAFPALHTSFPHDSLTNLTWVVTSYGVLFAALLTPAGRFADVFGRRTMFLGSLALFTLASLACAVAPDVPFLIAARAVQGMGSAGMIPSALGLLLAEVPAEKRAEAIGIWGATGSLAAAAGPSLGGVMVSEIDWRSVFVLNVPVGLAALIGGLRALPNRPGVGDSKKPDLVGTATITLGIAAVVVGLTKGGDWGWKSGETWGWIAGGAVLIAYALFRSSRQTAPAVEVQLYRTRMFSAASMVSFLVGAALFIWFLSGPLYLTTIWHYSILKAGLAVTPGAVASAIATVTVGRRVPPAKQRPYVVGGLVLFTGMSIWAYSVLGTRPSFLSVWLPYGVFGSIGLGVALTSVTTAAAISVHPMKFASGTGMNTTARQFGGSVGVAVMAAVFAAHNILQPQAYLDAFLLTAIFAGVAILPALTLFNRSGMAAVAETQRQFQQQMAAMMAAQKAQQEAQASGEAQPTGASQG